MSLQSAEIFVIGTEILQGEIPDLNGPALAQELSRRGVGLRRLVVLPDDKEVINQEIKSFLRSDARLLITAGGLGMGDDERITQHIASALQRPLELDDAALKLVHKRFQCLANEHQVENAKLTECRRRMAHLPRGSKPIANELGVAPGMTLESSEGTIICLPGSPQELRAMLDGPLGALLDHLIPPVVQEFETIEVPASEEERLLPAVRHVRERFGIQIKLRTVRQAEGLVFRVCLAAQGASTDAAHSLLNEALTELRDELMAGVGSTE